MSKKKSMHLSSICIVACFVMFVYFTNIKVSEGVVDDKDTVRHDTSPERCASNKNNDNARKASVQVNHGKIPLYFIENRGQVDKRVRFYEKGSGRVMYFTERGVYLSLIGSHGPEARSQRQTGQASRLSMNAIATNKGNEATSKSETWYPKSEIIRLVPLGANKSPEITAEGLQGGKVNYLIGNNPGKWKTNVPTYQAIIYKNVYKDIDIKFYGNNRQMEYDIIVKPGANPSHVQLSYQGIENLRITNDGDLEVRLRDGCLVQKTPYVYQEIEGKRVAVDGKFKVLRSRSGVKNQKMATVNSKLKTLYPLPDTRRSSLIYGFQVASYDKRYPLVIDPALVYSMYLGGNNIDYGYEIAVDTFGNAYIVGTTASTNFPASSALYEDNKGFTDVFVTKIDETGSNLVYSTYLGGNRTDWGYGISIDISGNAYVTGNTYSDDFPTTDSSVYKDFKGGLSDAFVSKLDQTGGSLIYSTYLGGSKEDWGYGVSADSSGNAYITGSTNSVDFPTYKPIYKDFKGGLSDAFVTKLDPTGGSLLYSTYLGGSEEDWGWGISVDSSENSYITGITKSIDYPVFNPISKDFAGGGSDSFVTKLNESGDSLIFSTYLGGDDEDIGYKIVSDTYGNAYITGITYSNDFPTTTAIYEVKNGLCDAFVTKLDPTGGSLVYSTYLGGSKEDVGFDIAVDSAGNAYVTGTTYSDDFPMASALYGIKKDDSTADAFVTKLDEAGGSILFSTYLGGNDEDWGYGIALDSSENMYVIGNTRSFDFPTASSLYGTNNGLVDVFVTQLTLENKPTASTGSATEVKHNSALLNGIANANGLATKAWFEYGTTSGSSTIRSSEKNIEGSDNTPISISINELSEGTTYFFRLAAENDEGSSVGGEESFTTTSCEMKSIELPVERMALKRGEKQEVTVTVNGKDTNESEDYCLIEDAEVKFDLDVTSKKLVKVLPKVKTTDENGVARFMIKAKQKLGIAVVKFRIKDTDFEKKLTVRIVK